MTTSTLDRDQMKVGSVVGRPHPWAPSLERGRLGLLKESMKLVYGASGINVILVLNPCSEADMRAMEASALRFGLSRMRGGYCWMVASAVGTFDAPYSPCIEDDPSALSWLADEDYVRTENTRAFVTIHVIDGLGVARRLNMVSVSPDFTRKLEAAHEAALAEGRMGMPEWDEEIRRFEARYPDPRAALRAAAATCKGGQ